MSEKPEFDPNDWEKRLSRALGSLAKAQEPFLQDHWKSNGYPTRHISNGKDETPFPTEDYSSIYESALIARTIGKKEYYKLLIEALAPIRSLLRTHPALAPILDMGLGSEAVQVRIGSRQTYTGIAQIISGIMARQYDKRAGTFLRPAQELNSLLSLSSGHTISPLKNNLDLGFHVDLFFGAQITKRHDLGSGYFIAPLAELRDYIEPDWFRDRAPDQVKYRDLNLFFGIVAPFRWKPGLCHVHGSISDKHRNDVPFLFHRIAAEFSELLSVILERPITWVYDFPETIAKPSKQLLGQFHGSESGRAGEFVGGFHNPFRKDEPADPNLVGRAVELFSRKSESDYAVIAPLLHRLAEAQRTFGRFAKEDQILDLAIIFERYFPEKKTYKKKLSLKISSTLGENEEEKAKISDDITHVYNVRNAIIHGGKNESDAELLSEIDQALENGFRYARALLLNSI